MAEEVDMPFACPRGDKGVCALPDAGSVAALVWDGEVSFLTGRLLQQVVRSSNPNAAEHVEAKADNSVTRTIRNWPDPRGRYRLTRESFIGTPDEGKWLYVECKPCGDIVRVPVS
jgi:hypothetical protein